MTISLKVFTLVSVMLSSMALADISVVSNTKTISLSGDSSELNAEVDPGKYVIEFTEIAPSASYEESVKFGSKEPTALTLPGNATTPFGDKGGDKQVAKVGDNSCVSVSSATNELLKATDEKKVKALVSKVEQALGTKTCNDHQKVKSAETAIGATKRSLEVELGEGRIVSVTLAKTGSKDKWEVSLETPLPGKWVANWGAAILPNEDEEYFSKDNGEGGYTITDKSGDGDLEIVPSIFYTWVPNYDSKKKWNHGPTLGLGLDSSDLAVFAGWNATYQNGIGVTAGIAVHKQERLLGEYNEGQTVSENIQTLTEEKYDTNWFVALVYSF